MNTPVSDQTLSVFHKWMACAFAASIMLSPETISMVGNYYGRVGFLGFLPVVLSLILYLLLNSQYLVRLRQNTGLDHDDLLAGKTAGGIAVIFPIAVKIIALVFLSTGLLVSSGFIFNEVFVYWFPNFGFAFILLTCIVLLQMLSQKTVFIAQVVFSSIAFSGLFILVISGFLQTTIYDGLSRFQWISMDLLSIEVFFMPVLFFIGMDLGLISMNNAHLPLIPRFKMVMHTVVIMGVFFIFYGFMALGYIPVDKLSQTTISHILIAKSVLGGTGRYIMGMVVISGTLAAGNALLMIIKNQTLVVLEHQGIINKPIYPKLLILLLGITVGVLMARGLAGYDILEVLIAGALILWLISYAWDPLLNATSMIRHPESGDHRFSIYLLKPLTVFLPFILSVIIFIVTSKAPSTLLMLIISVLTVSFLIGALLIRKHEN